MTATETTERDRLRLALTRLSNEVLASLPLMEPLARQEFGNTNYALLIQRAEEGRLLLSEIDNEEYSGTIRIIEE